MGSTVLRVRRYNQAMTRPRDFLEVLDNPDASALQIDDRGGALLLHLVVHIFFSDEELHEREVDLVARLVDGMSGDSLRARITELGGMAMDFEKLAETFPEHQDRLDIITLAEHAWWADNQIEPGEMDVADKLADVLDIHER